jgi:hypothetical protein
VWVCGITTQGSITTRLYIFASCVLAHMALSREATAADQIINLAECENLTVEQLHEIALAALEIRQYNIEEDTLDLIVGEQGNLKVEVLISAPQQVVIRWKEGFGHRRDQWLRNLKTSILWELTE